MTKNNILNFLYDSSNINGDLVAVTEPDGDYTYRELISRAYELSLSIKGRNVQPVVIYLPKSKDAVVSILSTIMSGNIYCPVDFSAPKNRLESIFTTLGDFSILTNSEGAARLESLGFSDNNIVNINSFGVSELSLDEIWFDLEKNVRHVIDTDPCYIIFTSGSTGVPKGVTVSHRNVIDYINWANDTYDVSRCDVIGSQAPFFFDNSTLDIYLTFSNSATLNLIPDSAFIFPQKTIDYLNEYRITTIFWVPSILVNIANFNLLENNKLPNLKNVLFAGEVMPAKHIKYWLKHHPEAFYSNLYGPTEITVDCTYYNVPSDWDGNSLPIGIACENSGIVILDENNNSSCEGELCVKGSGVSLGYWNNIKKTKDVFIQNPLNEKYNELIYKTGDLVKVVDGLIYYIGRKDHQIKHNGYRIELGEIESQLLSMNEIDLCVVGYLESTKHIYAFIQTNSDISVADLRGSLSKLLPKYMIPTKFEYLNSMELTPNGKVDRKKYEKKATEIFEARGI